MENTLKKNSLGGVLGLIQIIMLIAALAVSFYFYYNFPEQVPVHWNAAGEPDNFGSKEMGAFLLPAIMLGVYFLFDLLAKIDPRKERYAEFSKAFAIIKTAIMLVFFAIHIVAGLNILGYAVRVELWIPIVIGLMFIVIGNYFGKIRNNYFVGIRTPWTLSNEEVWNRTHRLGGKLFILGGVAMMLMGFIPVAARMPLLVVIIATIAVLPMVYSFVLYKKVQKE